MEFDRDLRSIQEARDLMRNAVAAQKQFAEFDQTQVDRICEAMCAACMANAEPLAKMANEETGFGRWEDKVLKNQLGSKIVWDSIKEMKTIGVLAEDPVSRTMDVAVPVGVVVALIPSTNPTSTVMYKTLISLKAGNAIVISPHPGAMNCILATVKVLQDAAKKATGGEAMVRAAYSSGNPALGVGPGNGPCFIEKTADIPLAVKQIFDSETFDNGTICASEQSIIVERCSKDAVVAELERQGGYFMTKDESDRVAKFIMRANNTMNPAIVGKDVRRIADMAGITIPAGTRVLLTEHTGIGKDQPYSREKLCPILAFFVVDSWEEACEKALELLHNEGSGHTMCLHSRDERIIREFALKKPVSRVLVNTPGALGGVGATTGLPPALTLGCGSVGGSATSDNVGPMNLINVRRLAYGLLELEDLRSGRTIPSKESEVVRSASGGSPQKPPKAKGSYLANGPAYLGNAAHSVEVTTSQPYNRIIKNGNHTR